MLAPRLCLLSVLSAVTSPTVLPRCPHQDLQFAFPNGLTVRESDTGEGDALLWVADSRNACIRQLLIQDVPDDKGDGAEAAETDGRPQSQPALPSPSPARLPSQRPGTSPGFLETFGPSPVAVPPFARPEPGLVDAPRQTQVMASSSLVGGVAAPDPDRDAEEGEHADPMRRGNANGTFEAATLAGTKSPY